MPEETEHTRAGAEMEQERIREAEHQRLQGQQPTADGDPSWSQQVAANRNEASHGVERRVNEVVDEDGEADGADGRQR